MSALRKFNSVIPARESDVEVTIVMSCFNEAETMAVCIRKATRFLMENHLSGEVLIADRGSTDGSRQIANALGARIVGVPEKTHVAALIGGVAAARGRYVIMGDADDGYAFERLMPVVATLRAGGELVMGDRFRGGVERGAMPPPHRWRGHPALGFVRRLLHAPPIGDLNGGLRGFHKDAIERLNLTARDMESAGEMVAKAALAGLDVREVPTAPSSDGRGRASHLRTWRDGWRVSAGPG